MKRDSSSVERDPQALAAFKAMDKGSSSLPFPPSVLLTKPLSASIEDDLPTHAGNDSSNASVSLPSLTEFIDSYIKPHIAPSFAPQSSPRTPRTPATPTSVPHSPSMRSSIYDEHHSYSSREHPSQTHKYQQPQHSQSSYQQQYIQQYQQIREQQMHEQHMYDQREIMQYREHQFQEQQLSRGILRDQHAREQQHELHEQLREQQQRLMNPYHYEQYSGDPTQRRSISEPYAKVKREAPTDYHQYSEPRLSVREQLKMNLLQREPGQNDPQERGNYVRAKGAPPPPSPLTSSNGVKHSGGFTQHMFAVPTSPSSSSPLSPTSYVPGSSKQGYGNSTPTHFDSTKFTNYTSQEFQYLSNKTHISSSSPASSSLSLSSASQSSSSSILAGSSGKWTAWENDKDVYKQAKLLSESLQCNVKSYLEATNTTSPRAVVPGTPPTPTTPSSPSLSIQRTPSASVPSLSVSPPASSPPPRASPRTSSLQTSTATKRKASFDTNTTPSKVQATSAQQHEYQKEAQLFSSKDISAGMHRFNTLLSNANMLDIYNKFNRPDEYAQYHTKSHQPSSASPTSSTTSPSTTQ